MPEQKRQWTLLEVLNWTRQHFEQKALETPRLDAEVLLSEVLQLPRVMLYARFDQPMQEHELKKMREFVAKRASGIPVARLLGHREFWSLKLEVNEHVLIPRPDSELAIEVSLKRAPSGTARIVDVGTGSGALALALATEFSSAQVWALDCSESALSVAQRNAISHTLDGRVHCLKSDLLKQLPDEAQPIELLVANLPYIPSKQIPHLDIDVRAHDPLLALDGGEEGLDLIRELIQTATTHLQEASVIVLESGSEQVKAIQTLLERHGFVDVEIANDLAGLPRITSGIYRP